MQASLTRVDLAGALVVLPPISHTNCIELKTATALATELAALTGRASQIIHEPLPPAPPRVRIFVGNTSALATHVVLSPPLRPEEGVAAAVGGDLYIFGDDAGAPLNASAGLCNCPSARGALGADIGVPHCLHEGSCLAGTFFASTGLLRDTLGMRWVWPGGDGVVRPPANASLSVSGALLQRNHPSLLKRGIRAMGLHYYTADFIATIADLYNATLAARIAADEDEWMLRQGLGGRSTPPWGQAFETWWSSYGQQHPEFFALHPDGTRGCQAPEDCSGGRPERVKMDVSEPTLWSFLASRVKPGDTGVSACEDDSASGFCTCDRCRALDPPERAGSATGSLSDRYAHFWSSVARALNESGRPDAWVTGYAYENYTDPPLRQKLEGKVLILSVAFSHYPTLPNETTYDRDGWEG